MFVSITPTQHKQVNDLVRSACANCIDDDCLLLDDSEEQQCVQLISRYGIYCNYLLNVVLPINKELYEAIKNQNEMR